MPRGNFDEEVHAIPMLAPADVASGTVQTDVVSFREHWYQFVIAIGAITGNATVYLKGCANTTASGTATALWTYRKSAALGTDTMGTQAAGSAAGIVITDGTDESKVMIVSVDPDAMNEAGYTYGFLEIVGGGALFVSVALLVWPRYPQNINVSVVV